jgi:hypothetical protein
MGDHEGFDIAGRPQDRLVERGRREPAGEPDAGLTVTGFLGDSDRPGYRRLYIDRRLERYVEFPTEAVIGGGEVPEDQLPFPGERATSVQLRRGTRVDVARTVTTDAFDLQPRVDGTISPVGADLFIVTELSGDCYSRRLRCTGPYCQETENPGDITTIPYTYTWPGFR